MFSHAVVTDSCFQSSTGQHRSKDCRALPRQIRLVRSCRSYDLARVSPAHLLGRDRADLPDYQA